MKGQGGRQSRNMATKLAVKERLHLTSQLLAKGYSVRYIAEQTGVSEATALRDCHKLYAQIPDPDITEHRKKERGRLEDLEDRLRNKLDAMSSAEDLEKTTNALIRVAERRAKLLGLDAPTKTEVEVSTVHVDIAGFDKL